MTEAGKNWVESKPDEHYTQRTDEAGFWLSAFCAEVGKRAAQFNRGYEGRADWCVAEAFKSVKRELLGQ